MQRKLLQEAEVYTKWNHRKKIWRRVVWAMGCVVAFYTTYALSLPAITMEKANLCGIEDHTHDQRCYAQVKEQTVEVLACPFETHVHTSECGKKCGKADFTVHIHSDLCLDEDGSLICTLPEIKAHTHAEDCWTMVEVPEEVETPETTEVMESAVAPEETGAAESAEATEETEATEATEAVVETQPVELVKDLTCEETEIIIHTHSEECYEVMTSAEGEEYQVLKCTMAEVVEHIHTEACIGKQIIPADTETLTCGLEESEDHIHGDLCYGTWELVCGLEAHTHSLACKSDINADVETAEDWEAVLPELSGNWNQDMVSIAKSQLGYSESTENYAVQDDGETMKGYTRYGVWSGDPYGDWNAVFAFFCLHYAGVDVLPMGSDCTDWVENLSSEDWDLFCPAEDAAPRPGDLVFFDENGDCKADRVGVVADVMEETVTDATRIIAIEGDWNDSVQSISYEQTNSTILGYVMLPTQEEEKSETFTLTAQTESGIMVTISGDLEALPYPAEEITVRAVEVFDEEIHALRDQMMEEENVEAEKHFLLDITLWHDEIKIEPSGPVTVTFSGLDTEGYYPHVFHIDTEAEEATNMEAAKDESGDVVVSTDHFSYYDVALASAPAGTGLSGDIDGQIYDGRTVYLSDTAWADEAIILNSGTTILDLNGNELYYKGTDSFITINNDAKLIIRDSGTATLNKNEASGNNYGRDAEISYNGNTVSTLTYYVTESQATDTGTTETLYRYELTPDGMIICENNGGAASVVCVNSGTFDLEGGLLTINKSSSFSGDSHIIFSKGTVNVKGGYICGGQDSGWGGGIYSEGTVNMSGGVIAANYGNNGGGIAVHNGTLNMSGGVISGNGVHETSMDDQNRDIGFGGGVFAKNATVTISGGYITNNSQKARCDLTGYGCHGGGGIATMGNCTLNMSGGYVTGNYSKEAGGGMYVGHYHVTSTTFGLSGGTVASNYAAESEGGGIRISGGTTATVQAAEGKKIYITNNATATGNDWGGGGVFVQANGHVVMYQSLITNNTAQGFGGGVASCPTGNTLIVSQQGPAIYNNNASGTARSGGEGEKNDDKQTVGDDPSYTGKKDTEFVSSQKYNDYYCVKAGGTTDVMLVMGEMLGGGAANWTGRIDGSAVSISKTGYETAQWLCGLTAAPSTESIDAAKEQATVIISGNTSSKHGGGIMTNGGLILGTVAEVETVCPALDITATKQYSVDGVSQTTGMADAFEFLLLKTEPQLGSDGKWQYAAADLVGSARTDASGKFTLSSLATYSATGTYTYYLVKNIGDDPAITYDQSIYTIAVNIKSNSASVLGVTFTSYYVDSIVVNKLGISDSSGNEETVNDTSFRLHYKNDYNWDNTYVHFWNAGFISNTSYPGIKLVDNELNDGWRTYTVTLDADESGYFSYLFNNGGTGNGNQTADFTGKNYSAGTDFWVDKDGNPIERPTDWIAASTDTTITSNVSVTGTSNSDESYSLTINGNAFTNTKTTPINVYLRLTKTDTGDNPQVLSGAEFSLVNQNDADDAFTGTSDENGLLTFGPLTRDAVYILTETNAPDGYMLPTAPWTVTVDASGVVVIEGVNTSQDESESTSITYTATITNQGGYRLPETGGSGTFMYTLGGILLSATPLVYGYSQRRKHERRDDG